MGALLLSGAAHAVSLNPRGTGQALVFPYCTVNGGHQTLVSVVNTTASGKALKVRFAEGCNGRDVLNFNVYLGGFDVWTAAGFSLDNFGPAYLATNDSSCTLPTLRSNTGSPLSVAFRNFPFSGPNSASDVGLQGLDRTREGFFEIIEMGALIANSLSERATRSGSNGQPVNCARLIAAWTPASGYWSQNANTDIAAPSGGLFGNAALVDVAEDIATAYLHVNGRMLRSDYRASTRAIDAVSAVYMAEQVVNEYNTEAATGASTKWVMTLPTKRFYNGPSADGGPAHRALSESLYF